MTRYKKLFYSFIIILVAQNISLADDTISVKAQRSSDIKPHHEHRAFHKKLADDLVHMLQEAYYGKYQVSSYLKARKKDNISIFKQTEKDAIAGTLQAELDFAMMNDYGNKDYGIEPDPMEAIYWYKTAAHQGSAKAAYMLGELYMYGRGTKADLSKALQYYHQSAQENDPAAFFRLGYMYDNGLGIEKDMSKSVMFYEKAAAYNYEPAFINLAIIYYEGKGVAQDYIKARDFFKKAALLGDVKAQLDLANMYYKGIGLSKVDYIQASYWYSRAAMNGNEEAKKRLIELHEHGVDGSHNYRESVLDSK